MGGVDKSVGGFQTAILVTALYNPERIKVLCAMKGIVYHYHLFMTIEEGVPIVRSLISVSLT
jgi:hypothetical protein